jgi:ABC-2 type transport system ATP-binding protein
VTDYALRTHELRRMFAGGAGLENLSVDARPGEVLALLGPNGAGKTTTVRLLNGVLARDSGRVDVLGLDPAVDGDAIRQRTGVLTENAGLDDRLSAFENLWFSARLRKMDHAQTRTRIDAMLEEFGLAERRDQPVQGMSTGQRKRVALIRALLHKPEVLFLDEPTSGLDPSATRAVLDLIARLAGEGHTIVLCTHFLGEAGRLADRVAILDHGRLHAFGRLEELAGALWPGIALAIDLGHGADAELVGYVSAMPGVLSATVSTTGMHLRVDSRARVPHLVNALVARAIDVYGATLQPDTLEQVYFAIEAQIRSRDATTTTSVAA